jgi:hypothetical protein
MKDAIRNSDGELDFNLFDGYDELVDDETRETVKAALERGYIADDAWNGVRCLCAALLFFFFFLSAFIFHLPSVANGGVNEKRLLEEIVPIRQELRARRPPRRRAMRMRMRMRMQMQMPTPTPTPTPTPMPTPTQMLMLMPMPRVRALARVRVRLQEAKATMPRLNLREFNNKLGCPGPANHPAARSPGKR